MSAKFISLVLPKAEVDFTALKSKSADGDSARPAEPKFVDIYEEASSRARAKQLAQAPQRLQFHSLFRPNPYSKKT